MILFDTPGVIEKKMHKLDSMMMKNVRSAAVNADCVLVVVDSCKAPEKVFFYLWETCLFSLLLLRHITLANPSLSSVFFPCLRLMKYWKKGLGA